MSTKIVLCNCKGLCPSFEKADMNTLPFQLEAELDVSYSVVHPQLCGQGGNTLLLEILRASVADPEAQVVSGACAPKAQEKLFRKVMRLAAFPADRFVAVDIRGTDNAGILARLREAVEGITPQTPSAPVVDDGARP